MFVHFMRQINNPVYLDAAHPADNHKIMRIDCSYIPKASFK